MLAIMDVNSAVDGIDKLQHASNWLSGGELLGLVLGSGGIICATLIFFGTPIAIVSMMLRHRTNKQREINELVLRLAEKGQPIPPELFMEQVRQKSDLRRGVIWASVGLGLVILGAFNDESGMMGIGFIPLMIGIGFALAAWLEKKQKERQL